MSKLKVSGTPPQNVQKHSELLSPHKSVTTLTLRTGTSSVTKHIFSLIHDKNLQDSLLVTQGNVSNL